MGVAEAAEHLGALAFGGGGHARGACQAAAERERTEVLGRLSDAHLAVLAGPSLQARLQSVCERAMALVGGAHAHVELRGAPGTRRIASRGDGPVGAPPSHVPILADGPRPARGVADSGWHLGEADRAVLGQLALLASGARRGWNRSGWRRSSCNAASCPATLPDHERSDGGGYLASGRSQGVGGDWYDVRRSATTVRRRGRRRHGSRPARGVTHGRHAGGVSRLRHRGGAGPRHRGACRSLCTRLAPDHLATAVMA